MADPTIFENDPLWYKDAVIYELHVRAFCDSNNDGIGDFRGLTSKLDYIQDLGVNTIWLLPFYPSPMRDDGYDISDYRAIHPDYGTMADFRQFVREAHKRGLKVVTELVINHTSDQHPWFQAARRAPAGSMKRNYYVWSDTAKKFPETRIIFTDSEKSNWAWDDMAKAYYWHRFFSHQPDLNHNNPHVVKAVMRVMRFWLDAGVDGLRLDAIPYLCVREGTGNENLPETHAVIKYMRAELDRHYQGRMFLAEANQWPEDVREYFGRGDECHMAYHFPLMPRLYMAIAQEDRHPIIEIMRQTPDIPDNCQWAIFLRNHDELTLEMVTDRERDYMYQIYAADPRMRVNVGIRRRLAPLMENDRSRIELMNSLLMSMPGSPIVYYGDEVGMGDNFFLGDRNGVRTPMQWSPDRNAGFSRADPQRLYLPPIMDPIYGYESVNVEAQSRSASSLLNWTRRLLTVRKAHQSFGRGALTFLRPGNRKILAYLRQYGEETVLCVANLSRSAQPVELDLSGFKGVIPVELLGRTPFPPIGELPYLLTLPGYGFYWFRLEAEGEVPHWHDERAVAPELPVLVLTDGWNTLFSGGAGSGDDVRRLTAHRARSQLQQEVLPGFLLAQRWFAAKGHAIDRAEATLDAEWAASGGSWLLALVDVDSKDGSVGRYFVPMSLLWEDGSEDKVRPLLHRTLAKVRQRARVGILYDALADDAFCHALVEAMGSRQTLKLNGGELQFGATSAFPDLTAGLEEEVSRPALEQSNTSVILADKLVLKVYRRVQSGVNPELEMGRFLTDVSPYPNVAPLAGTLVFADDASGETTALAILQGYVDNQGSGWQYTVDYLDRFLENALSGVAPAEPGTDVHGGFLATIRTLGLRTGELHRALSKPTMDPNFAQEPITQADVAEWTHALQQDAERTLDMLETRRVGLSLGAQERIGRLLEQRVAIQDRIDPAAFTKLRAVKTRHHGDYHLGQVLLVQNDFVIIDFEGEPSRPLSERRRKHSPLRDVAGMLRSFSYAAAVSAEDATRERPEQRPLAQVMVRDWEAAARTVFLAGYRVGAAGCPAYPANEEHARQLIEFFVLEKALYEIRYELDHRPDWVEVPVEGLLGLVGRDGLSPAFG